MKQDTKDWLKRTAGTSTLVASPGVIAATAIGGPLAGLAVGGAVAAGNVVGSLAYKKYRDVKEDLENRKKFRELQRHVLAQNGILYYQPMVPSPNLDMSCSKDMSCLNKILKKDFTVNEQVGNFIYKTPVGQVIDKGINLLDNYGGGVIVRNGNTVRGGFKNLTGFSEENLLSVDEEELKHMRDDINFTNDPSDKELKKSRYLSMLSESSRDCLLDMLKEKSECCEPCEPVKMFSESSSLGKISKGRDFGAIGTLLTGVATATGLRGGGLASKAADKIAGAFRGAKKNQDIIDNAVKGMESAAKAKADNPNGGFLNSVLKGSRDVANSARTVFGKKPLKGYEATKKGAETVAKQVANRSDEILKQSKESIEGVKRLSANNLTRAQVKTLKAASNSSITANAINNLGLDAVTNINKGIEAASAAATADAVRKSREKENQQRA